MKGTFLHLFVPLIFNVYIISSYKQPTLILIWKQKRETKPLDNVSFFLELQKEEICYLSKVSRNGFRVT